MRTGSAPPNSLYNPTISSIANGQVKHSFSMSSVHVGTLLGSRGSNVSAIRIASGAKIKVQVGY